MSKGLTKEQILADLNSSWWTTSYLNPPTTVEETAGTYPQTVLSTMIYFQDQENNWHAWQSTGVIDPFGLDQESNYLTAIMNECAYELSNMNCFGGITNIKPADYQVFPIYFK